MPAKKIKQTPDFVKGLLKSADLIGKSLPWSPRWLAQEMGSGKRKMADLTCKERQKLGKYQGRVVLAALAAELALKWLWEQENQPKSFPSTTHDLLSVFGKLKPGSKETIEAEYLKRVDPQSCWGSAEYVFKIYKDAFVDWRYVVEEGWVNDYVMYGT